MTLPRPLTASLTVVAAVAAAGAVPSSSDARPSRPRCTTHAGVIAANASAVVFRVSSRQARRGRDAGSYACDIRSRRVRFLGGFDRDVGGTRLVRLAGRYVGWHTWLCNAAGCGGGAFVLDVTRGTRRVRDDPEASGPALGLRVTPAGSVAWVRPRFIPGAERYEVVVAEPGAAARVVEDGPLAQFAANSLAVAGGRTYWFAQGRAASAAAR
jgi:hypothetical protein